MMRTFLTLLAVLSFSSAAAAQSGPCTEAAIKAAKTAAWKGALPHTSGQYFFSGALDEPVIGTQPRAKAGSAIAATRKNESEVETTGRIVPADSADMAYEYGTVHITYDDAKTGEHNVFTSAYLRVWKSDDGVCKVAAEIAEPENTQQPTAKK